MNTTCCKLSEQYLTALRQYLADGTQTDLSSATKLGRKAFRSGVSVPEVSHIHTEALMLLMPPTLAASEREKMTKCLNAFFCHTLAAQEEAASGVSPAAAAKKMQTSAVVADLSMLKKLLQHERAKLKFAEKTSEKRRLQYVRLLAESRTMQKQLRHLTYELLRAQEEERKKISRELHDDISQILTGINVRLAALKIEASANTGSLTRKIGNTQRLVEKSVEAVHRFARELRPAMLDDLGLIPALTSYLKDVRKRTGLQIRFAASKDITALALDSAQRTVLYRIAQEAITNVTKHARASQLHISLKNVATAIFLEVTDDGKAFSVPDALANKKCKHLGLIGMRERAEMLGGKFDIESAPGKGTSVRVHIPLRNGNGK